MGIDPISLALITGAVAAAGAGTATAISASKSPKAQSVSPSSLASKSTEVGTPKTKEELEGKRVGRTALIASSPQGVLGNPSVGRRKLLGN